MTNINSFRESGERYKILRFLGDLLIGSGAFLLTVGTVLFVFGVYVLCRASTDQTQGVDHFVGSVNVTRWVAGLSGTVVLMWSIFSTLAGLQLIGYGAFLRLMIHLEENTRASAQALDKMRVSLESIERRENVEQSLQV